MNASVEGGPGHIDKPGRAKKPGAAEFYNRMCTGMGGATAVPRRCLGSEVAPHGPPGTPSQTSDD